jgi:hypothetical protein
MAHPAADAMTTKEVAVAAEVVVVAGKQRVALSCGQHGFMEW